MALQNNLRVRIDAEFPGEGTFKSAESSAKVLARELQKVEDATRKMAAAEFEAYRESEKRASDRESAIRKMAAAEAAAYRESEQAAERAAAAQEKAGEAQRAAMTKVGTAMSVVSAATVTGLGLATKAAMDWESAWAGVTKTTDGTPQQMAALEDSLRQLATTLPATHEEIAGVAEAAGQLGVKRTDLVGFTRTMLDLGNTTNLTAEDAATGLAKLMNVMGTAPQDVSRLGATLVALGNDGASTEADILSMAQRISGAGKLVGASEADVLALANALSSVGVEAELGGGVTTRVMQKIYSAVKEGGDGLAAFAEVSGVSSAQFAAQWEASPVRALDSFFQGLNRVDASGGNVVATLADLGLKGTEEASVLLRMKGAGDLLTRSLDLGATAWQENAALAAEANKRYETTEAKLEIARNKINETAIDIGGNLLPALAAGGEFAGNLASAFGGLSEDQQKWVTGLGVGAAGITGLVGVAAVGIPKVVELKNTLDDLAGGSSRVGKGLGAALGVLTGPWGLALAGATALIGAWAAKQGEARQKVEELSAALDAQTGAVTGQARQLKIDDLVDAGVMEDAKRFGIALDQVTEAALGNKEALAAIEAQTEKMPGTYNGMRNTMVDLADGSRISTTELDRFVGAVRESAGVTSEAQEKARLKAEAMGLDADATADAGTAAATTAEQQAQLVSELTNGESAATGLEESIKALSDALDVLNGGQLDANAAARAWEEAIDSAQEALDKNGATLDVSTEKGRANAAALDAMAKAAMENGLALMGNGGSYEEFNASLEDARGKLLATAKQFGLNDQAAQAYVDSVLEIPSQAQTNVMLQGITSANTQVQALLDRLAAMPREKITSVRVNEIVNRGGNTGGGYSEGGWTGPGAKLQPAGVVHADEFVIRKESRQKIEATRPGLLAHLNAYGSMPGYADGGLVGAMAAGGPAGHAPVSLTSLRDTLATVTA